jgi:hypothetical protein
MMLIGVVTFTSRTISRYEPVDALRGLVTSYE